MMTMVLLLWHRWICDIFCRWEIIECARILSHQMPIDTKYVNETVINHQLKSRWIFCFSIFLLLRAEKRKKTDFDSFLFLILSSFAYTAHDFVLVERFSLWFFYFLKQFPIQGVARVYYFYRKYNSTIWH